MELSERKRSTLFIQLLKGPLYADTHPNLWNDLLLLKAQVRDYMRQLGLELFMDEDEGHSFLRQIDLANLSDGDKDEETLPSLVNKRPLGFKLSLLLALLRKAMVEHDIQGDRAPFILERKNLFQMMAIYLPYQNNEVKMKKQVDESINKLKDIFSNFEKL